MSIIHHVNRKKDGYKTISIDAIKAHKLVHIFDNFQLISNRSEIS